SPPRNHLDSFLLTISLRRWPHNQRRFRLDACPARASDWQWSDMNLGRWIDWRRPAPIATAEALRAFLFAEAALVAQKCMIGYCHVKPRLPLHELMRDEPFRIAYEGARWEAFAAVLTDLAEIVEGHLRPAVGERQADLADRVADLCGAALAGQPRPARAGGDWRDTEEEVRQL